MDVVGVLTDEQLLNMLAEAATREFSETEQPMGSGQNRLTKGIRMRTP